MSSGIRTRSATASHGAPAAALPLAGAGSSLTERRAAAVRAAAHQGLVTDTSPVVGFIDLAGIAASQAELISAFAFAPAPILHTFAAKASSLVPILRLFAEAGMGCEAASRGELAQALAAGFPPDRIVLDSPVKTRSELRDALRSGVAINADNFAELERIDTLLRELGHGPDEAAPTDHAARTDQPPPIGSAAQAEHAPPTDRAGRTDRTAPPTDRAEQTNHALPTDRAGQTDRTALTDRAGQTNHAPPTDRAGQPGQSPSTDRAAKSSYAAPPAPVLGLRINPQVGAGSIEAMSTASARSKFGVPLEDSGGRQAILAAFDRYPWLTRLHVHVGSQGCPLELIAAGIRQVYELAEQINASPGAGRVTSIDIGGGLPVNFDDDRVSPTFAEYVEVVRGAVPGLFDGRYGLVTEFGRALTAKNGFTLARVEYVKPVADRRVALTHAGAQVATRTVFMPDAWPLRVSPYTADGEPKHVPTCLHDVAGPCCFAGDLVAAGRELAQLDEGDLIALHDTGGYFFTATWTYKSLPRPAVYGFEIAADGSVHFTLMRRQQTLEELVAEAGGDPASTHALTAEPDHV